MGRSEIEKCLTFEKGPLFKGTLKKGFGTTLLLYSSSELKKRNQIKKITAAISSRFIKNTLGSVVKFIQQESEASLIFNKLTKDEARFIKKFCTILKQQMLFNDLFSPMCRNLLWKIKNELDSRHQFQIVSDTTVDRMTSERCVTLKKVPRLSNKKKKSKKGNVNSVTNESIENLLSRLSVKQDASSNQKNSKNITFEPEKKMPLQEVNDQMQPVTIAIGSKADVENVDKRIKSQIEEHPKKIKPSTTPNKSAIDARKLPEREAKLIEGLSTPIESAIGLRMMHAMGWGGGALGVREDGIKEPIMPRVDLVRKAGFGHVKGGNSETSKSSKDRTKQTPSQASRPSRVREITDSIKRSLSIYPDQSCPKSEGHNTTDEDIVSLLTPREQKISKKALNKLKKRLFLMISCLDLLEGSRESVNIDCRMQSKSKRYLKLLCRSINRGKAEKFAYSIETCVWLEISRFKDHCVIPSIKTKSFTLRKVSRDDGSSVIATPDQMSEVESSDSDEDDADETLSRPAVNVAQNGSVEHKERSVKEKAATIFEFTNKNDSQQFHENEYPSKFNFSLKINNTKMTSPSNSCTNVRITRKTGEKMTAQIAKNVQKSIAKELNPKSLPRLKCHGVHDDSLIYSCYDDKSYEFLKNVLTCYQIVKYDVTGSHIVRVSAKVFGGSCKSVLALLKLYHDVDVGSWEVQQITQYDDQMTFSAVVDKNSFKYICDNYFSLSAGVCDLLFEIIS
ncbi:unnamed protein product [Leptosia nina]|uniref:G-patch domain-containing protein n=1 Tax=Leptosia nina TaxID=320188 RepID=A0AAV1JL75_9NEOP